jgi:transposase
VEQIEFGKVEKSTKFDRFTRDELIDQNQTLESQLTSALKEIYRLKNQHLSESQLNLVLQEHLGELNRALYGASSERYKRPEGKPKDKTPAKPRIKKPSERYPNVPVREVHIPMDTAPQCDACGAQMRDSGMTEESEQLTVIPKKYEIIRNLRAVYTCACHSCMKTAPNPPRILDGSTYSDEMILDVVLSKYCDLIPIGRYVQMASRGGLIDLPPNTLIDLTHQFAFFVKDIYRKIGEGILQARVLQADETPHRMLEGSEKKSWYLWGFSTDTLCFLECHDTRSGDVASEILLKSKCEVLVTDVYAGYGKATRVANLERGKLGLPQIVNAHCNSHVRRNFFKLQGNYPEACFYLDHYHEIYQLNSQAKAVANCREKPPNEVLELREKMRPHFEAMRDRAMEDLPRYPKSNKYEKALTYLLNDYEGFTRFL